MGTASVGNVTVTENEEFIEVTCKNPSAIMRDLKNLLWRENIVSLFLVLKNKTITIHKFFGLEFYLMLQMLMEDRTIFCDLKSIQSIIDGLEQNTWIADIKRKFPSKVNYLLQEDFTAKLFDFQLKFLEKYDQTTQQYHLNGMLLAGAAGSGKTLTSLVTMHCLNCKKVIIICPKNAVYKVWQDNIERFFKKPQTYWCSPDNKKYNDERFIIVHYEAMEKAIQCIKEGEDYGLILDESHNLNELGTRRVDTLIKFCKLAKPRESIFASGTPIKALAIETLPLFTILDNFFNEEVSVIFQNLYKQNISIVKEIMRRRLNEVVYKIEKSQLGLDKPIINNIFIKTPRIKEFVLDTIRDKIREYVKTVSADYKTNMPKYIERFNQMVDIAKDHYLKNNPDDTLAVARFEEYKKLAMEVKYAHDRNNLWTIPEKTKKCKELETTLILKNIPTKVERDEFRELKSIVKYYRLKVQGDAVGKIVTQARIEANIEISNLLDYELLFNSTKKKTIVFTEYTEVAEAVKTRVEKLGFKPACVYGDSTSQLKSIVTTFENNKDINPLIATYKALSTAVPLIAADQQLLIGLPWRDYQLNQAISRIHRLGADTQARINIFGLDSTPDVNITDRTFNILTWSQLQVSEITGLENPYRLERDKPEELNEELKSAIRKFAPSVDLLPDSMTDKFISLLKRLNPIQFIKNW